MPTSVLIVSQIEKIFNVLSPLQRLTDLIFIIVTRPTSKRPLSFTFKDHMLSYLFEGTGEINRTSPPQSPKYLGSTSDSHETQPLCRFDSLEKTSKNGYNPTINIAAPPRTPAVHFYSNNPGRQSSRIEPPSDDRQQQAIPMMPAMIMFNHADRGEFTQQKQDDFVSVIAKSFSASATTPNNGETLNRIDSMMMPPPPQVARFQNAPQSADNYSRPNTTHDVPPVLPKLSNEKRTDLSNHQTDNIHFLNNNDMNNHMMWLQQINSKVAADERKQHLQWLQHMNNIAQQSGTKLGIVPNQSSTQSCGNVQHIMHQQIQFHIAQHLDTGLPQPSANGKIENNSQIPALFENSKPSSAEIEERRLRRLARNRLSARLSRRRKKEGLETLSQVVEKLSDDFCKARREHIMVMEEKLKAHKYIMICKLQDNIAKSPDSNKKFLQSELEKIQTNTSINSVERSAATDFQWEFISNLILPVRSKFILWSLLQKRFFFTFGKDYGIEKSSSKQVGEKMHIDGKNSSCVEEMWPLFCYELSISYDQEQSIIQGIVRCKRNSKLQTYKKKLSEVLSTSREVHEIISTSQKEVESKSCKQILTPEQHIKFLAWFHENSNRCCKMLESRKEYKPVSENKNLPAYASINELRACLDKILSNKKKRADAKRDLEFN